MANILKIKAGSGVPTTSDIVDREIAFNRSDNKLYINDSGTIVNLSGAQGGGSADEADRIVFDAQAGEALSKGDVIYISGISGNTPIVSKADADDANKMPAFGLAAESATLNNSVQIVTFGTLENFDTSAFSVGDTVFVSTTAGALTATKPTGESGLIQNMGHIVRSHASTGAIKIVGAGRTAATPNLNQDKIFLGNASNQSTPTALSSIGLSKFNNDSGFTTNTGDITAVTAGTGLDGGGLSGDVSLSLDLTEVGFGGGANRLITDDGDGTVSTEANLTFDGTNLAIASTGRIYLDGGGDTFWYEASPDVAMLVSGGIERLRTTSTGSVVINAPNNSMDFKVEGSTDANLFFVDGSADRVGIGTSSPDYELDVAGDIGVNHVIYHNDDTNTYHQFTTDRQRFFAGGELLLDLFEGTQDYVKLGDGGDVDINLNDDMFVEGSSGNVGIGTTSPGAKLHIYDAFPAVPELRVDNNNHTMKIQANGTASVIDSTATNTLMVRASGSTKMTILNSGNVGIGTESPSKKFVVKGASGDQARFEHNGAVGAVDIYSGTDGGLINVRNASGTSIIELDGRSGNLELPYGRITDAGTDMNIVSDNALTLQSSAGTALTIPNASTNVGIGTSSPTDLLHIADTVSSNALVTMRTQNSLGYAEFGTQSNYARLLSNGTLLYAGTSSQHFHYIGGSTAMTLNGTGLGIGTSPSQKLHVAGSVRADTAYYVDGNIVINTDGNFEVHDTRSTTPSTDIGLKGVRFDFKQNSTDGLSDGGTYHGVMTFQQWNDTSGGHIHALGFTDNGYVHHRNASIGGTFGNWKKLIQEDESGNVGIGTASPAVDLHILDTGGHSQLRIETDSASHGAYLELESTTNKYQIYNVGGDLGIDEAGVATRLTIKDTSGNVGIGTSSPSASLHINTTNDASLYFTRGGLYPWSIEHDTSQLYFYNRTINKSIIKLTHAGTMVINNDKNASVDFRVAGTVDTYGLFYDASANAVGIGTSDLNSNYKMIVKRTTNCNLGVGLQGGELSLEAFNDAITASVPFRLYGSEFNMLGGNVLIGGTSASGHGFNLEVLNDHAYVKGPDGWNGTGDKAIVALGSGVSNESFGCGYVYGTGLVLSTYKLSGGGDFGSSTQNSLVITDTVGQAKFINDVVAFATSDKRLKENVKPLDNALEKINKINGVEFDWIDGKDEHGNNVHGNEGHDVGVIAQEIEEVLPEVVHTRDNGYKAVKYEKIVPLLIQAIKEQQQQINKLEEKLNG